jgi:hypothetical protein
MERKADMSKINEESSEKKKREKSRCMPKKNIFLSLFCFCVVKADGSLLQMS